MERKYFLIALVLFGVHAYADIQSRVDYFSKTFTHLNVEINQKPSSTPYFAHAIIASKKNHIVLEGNFSQLDPDVLDLVLCHELGHVEGEFPRAPLRYDEVGVTGADGRGLYGSEGAADYFATYKCLKYLWRNQFYEIKNPDFVAKEKCEKKFNNLNEVNTCMRSAEAALKFLDVRPWPKVSYTTPSREIAASTIVDSYPSRQCRLDTLLAGALNESRPTCWYRENALEPNRLNIVQSLLFN